MNTPKYRVFIRRNSDSEIREWINPFNGGWDATEHIHWSVGCYSCDCIRELMFTKDDSPFRGKCGKGRFSVRIDAQVYEDGDWT